MTEVMYNFVPQPPKGITKIKAVGYLSIDHDCACFMVGDGQSQKIIAKLSRPVVSYIGPHGIKINGFEFAGNDKKGMPRYYYREWYCSYQGLKK